MYRYLSLLLLLPLAAHAQWMGALDIFDFFIDFFTQLIPLFVAIAVLVFFWGIVKFIAHADDPKTHEDGKTLMIWGMVALFVMVALWGIVGYFQESLGLNSSGYLGELPTIPSTIPVP